MSALGRLPQYALAKTPYYENAKLVAVALNEWAMGPAADVVLEVLQADLDAARSKAGELSAVIAWALGDGAEEFVKPSDHSDWRRQLRQRAGL